MIEEQLIFFPTRYPDGDWRPDQLDFKDVPFTAEDGTRLHGWYMPCGRPRAAILFAHGNGGNLSHRADLYRVLQLQLNVAVFAFDYRGYGRSEGSPSEAGVLADARAARRIAAEQSGARERDLVLYGESLGGAVVVDLAATDGTRGLILENTFSSLLDVAAVHYPWLPARMLIRSRFDSVAKISRYRGPLLQIHGDADTIIPIELGQRLFAAANEPKQWVTIRDADHNDPRQPAAYAAIDQFLQRLSPVT